jgi:preflagellin peptidase FlaK
MFYFLIFVALIFLICYLFWKFGIFAGGDAKLYSGIAATIPILNFSLLYNFNSGLPFVLSLFLLSILLMLPLASLKLFIGYFKNIKVKELVKKSIKENTLKFILNITYVVSLYFIFSFFILPLWLFFICSIILGFVPKIIRYPISIILFIISLILNPLQTGYIILISIVFAFILGMIIKMYVLSKSGVLNYSKKISDLKDGDLLARPIIKDKNGKYSELNYNFLKELKIAFKKAIKGDKNAISNVLSNRKDLYSKIVINNSLACGLTVKEIKQLKAHYVGDKIELKETTPLVPSIFIAYVILICFGDVIWLLSSLIS